MTYSCAGKNALNYQKLSESWFIDFNCVNIVEISLVLPFYISDTLVLNTNSSVVIILELEVHIVSVLKH